jgi:heat-inducible transcriptional repressor
VTLDQRAVEVLRIVIEEHVKSGEPVSSRRTARLHAEQLSPATIRNIMADLTDDGYLEQPHTSAGRVPTDRGYRFFVDDALGNKIRLPAREVRQIKDLLASTRELDELLSRATRLLADMTHQVGVVLAPDLEQAVLEHVDFVRIGPHRLVAIFVSRTGVVTHRVLDVDEDLPQDGLDRLGAKLRQQLVGYTLPEVRRRMIELLREDQDWARRIGREAVSRVVGFLEKPFPEEAGELRLEGTSSLLELPEFADVQRLRDALRTLEERTQLVRLLDRCLAAPGVQVIIGAETKDPSLALMSVVTSPYRAGRTGRGLVGVVGSRRMEYARAVAIVDELARTISDILNAEERERDPEQRQPGAEDR